MNYGPIKDHWNNRGILKDIFQKLYALTNFTGVSIEIFIHLGDCYDHSGTAFWSRSLRNWEMELVDELDQVISSVLLNPINDTIQWLPGNGHQYSVKRGTHIISDSKSVSSIVTQVPRDLWKLHIPQKIKIFIWKLVCNVFPTRDFLAHRITDRKDSKYCSSCPNSPEISHHIFWSCNVSRRIWRKCLDWWGFYYKPLPTNITDSWNMALWFKDASIRRVWKLTIIATIWTLWLSRNERVFNKTVISEASLMILLQKRSQEWNLATNFISQEHVKWWENNPVGVVTRTKDEIEKEILHHDCDFICFIDGSWIKNSNGTFSAGIGGIAKTTEGSIVMVFSGPHYAENAFMVEVKSLETLAWLIENCGKQKSSFLVYIDNAELVLKLKEFKALKTTNLSIEESCKSSILSLNISFKKIDRTFNREADIWAKQGRRRQDFFYFWN